MNAPAGRGLTAPDGYLWARGSRPEATWHFVRAGELVSRGTARNVARSLCGLWASTMPGREGWEEVVQRVTPGPRRMCASCLASAADAQRRDRLVTPPAVQSRLR
jgi:hypothetical protein